VLRLQNAFADRHDAGVHLVLVPDMRLTVVHGLDDRDLTMAAALGSSLHLTEDQNQQFSLLWKSPLFFPHH